MAALLQSAAKQMGERVQNAEIAFFGGSFTAIDPAYRSALLKQRTQHAKHTALPVSAALRGRMPLMMNV